ncbi:MAG: hypothetical protein AB7E49_06475 [Campylobacterales bacterium]
MPKLTQEEREVIDYVEQGRPKSVENLAGEMERYRQMARTQLNKRKAISIRLLESDLESLKARAVQEGIPYQTLIGSVIHKYLSGELKSA